jgi:phosphopentomutase
MIRERPVNRVILVIMDSLGIGALPDAGDYGDEGTDTFTHIHEYYLENLGRKLNIPNLSKMGFGNIKGSDGKPIAGGAYVCEDPQGSYGRAREVSAGKDTLTGHWEIAGLRTETAFETYPDGFPEEFMKKFEKAIGRETIGNKAASGTEIIEELGPEHEKTGKPIIYTSSDSVFQVAAYVEKIPLGELYEICTKARELLDEELPCARVIARPYYKDSRGRRIRMPDRRDYAVDPPGETLLEKMEKREKYVYSIGKIKDIFNKKGIRFMSPNTEDNNDGMLKTLGAVD